VQTYTQEGQSALQNIASRYNLSYESICLMFQSVNNGGGTMAQFFIPEWGSGQWMKGGMTMCGDMFNTGLQATVSNLCDELSTLMETTIVFEPMPDSSSGLASTTWWPSELGYPDTSGGQNNLRYAYFRQHCRMAIDVSGVISIYDTLDHQIGGVQQQQGEGHSVTFTSQYGTVDPINLPLISGLGSISEYSPQTPSSTDESKSNTLVEVLEPSNVKTHSAEKSADIFKNIESLSDLYQAGVLTQNEFETKKAELLSRI